MSATTIQVPADQVEAIRASLIGRRGEGRPSAEIDGLLGQLNGAASGGSYELTGSRSIIWSAVYDSLCLAAEQLAEECNEYWRGCTDPQAARSRIADVAARLELLVGLGAPLGD